MSVAFFRTKKSVERVEKQSWSNQEVADFYRAVDILKRAGLDVDVDSGVTDEGEPWFVFVREPDGEVLAHFAHINGEFIAVSSMNHEVYKGADIRQIVDQMLDRHPVIMPKNSGGTSLLLHPTAAVTAFLAAAFIMNVEGIKPSSIKEVLVTVAAKGASGVAESAVQLQGNSRLDATKWGSSETTSLNYNVVILGAALIAHELTSTDVIGVDRKSADSLASPFYDNKTDVEAEIDLSLLVGELADISFGTVDDSETQVENTHVQSGVEGGRFATKSNKSLKNTKQEMPGDFAAGELNNKNVAELAGEYIGIFEPKNQKPKNEDRDQAQTLELALASSFNSSAGFEPLVRSGSKDTVSVKTSIRDPQNVIEKAAFNFELESVLAIDSFGIAVDEISLLSLQTNELRGDFVVLADTHNSNLQHVSSTMGLFGGGGHHDGSINDAVVLEDPSEVKLAESTATQLPIIGHSTVDTHDAVEMTSGIDVVFYQGGDVEVDGFELGVDLLWFFLSADEVTKGQSSVNEKGDVVLEFGEIGSLVFLSLVPQLTDDFMV